MCHKKREVTIWSMRFSEIFSSDGHKSKGFNGKSGSLEVIVAVLTSSKEQENVLMLHFQCKIVSAAVCLFDNCIRKK